MQDVDVKEIFLQYGEGTAATAVPADTEPADTEPAEPTAAEPAEPADTEPADTVPEEPTAEPTAAATAVPAEPQADARLDRLADGLDALRTLFERRLQYDETKETIVSRLHGELQTYKDDLYGKLTRPLLCEMAGVILELERLRPRYAARADEAAAEALRVLDGAIESIEVALDPYGVARLDCAAGEKFRSGRQRIAKTVPTDDSQQNGTVAEVVLPGYALGESVLIPARVTVYKYEKAEESK